MATKEGIEHFLGDFKYKLGFWGLFIRSDRDKNFKTLTVLEFRVEDVKKELNELNELNVVHYSEGPVKETLYNGADMWIFGKVIQNKEVYIKISLGQPSDKAICISFHFSDYSMTYPYKSK
jgi:hypothetical protein